MIFKTFNSDIDKTSTKWGVFGKSFNDIGNAIVGKISDINESFQDTNDLLGAFKNTDSVWKRLYPGKESIQSQMIDVDTLYPDIDDSVAQKILSDLQQQQNLIDITKGSWSDYFKEFKEGEKWQIEFVQNNDLQKASLDDVKKSYEGARQSAIDHNNALKQQTLGAKAATVATQALAAVCNMLIGALIAKGIELAVKAIDNYVNRAKYAAEAMQEAQEKIDDAQNSLKNMTTTLSENKDRFLQLSKGVSEFSENLHLSEEDYAEYLSISNELAELFPTLVSGYDEQGNALLAIGSNADETNEKLQELLETQQAVAQQTLIDNMDKVADGIYYEVEATKNEIDGLQEQLSLLQKDYENVNINLASSNGLVSFRTEDYSKYGEAMKKALSAANIEFTETTAAGNDTAIQLISWSPQQLEKAQEFYDAFLETENRYYKATENGLKKDIAEKEKAFETSYSKMTKNLQAWVKDNYNYQYLSDNSSKIVDAIIPEINWKEVNESGVPLMTAWDYQNYVEENIINPLMQVPEEHKAEIDRMFQQLLSFENGDLDVLQFAEQLRIRLNEFGIKINITPIIADEQDTKNRLQNSIDSIAEGGSADFFTSSGKRVDAEDYKTLQEYTKDFNKEQIELWNSSTLGAKNAIEAIAMYEDALKSASDVDGNNLLNFEDAFNSTNFAEAKQSLLDLAKAGELTSYTLSSTKEYNSLLEQTGLTAEQVYSKIMKIAHSDMSDADWNNTLANARSQIAKIDELLNELNTNGQTNSVVDGIIADYPQLLEYLGDEKALREQLKTLQEEQEDVVRKAYTQLVADSEAYYNTFKTQETERLNTLNNTINTTISSNKYLVDVLGKNYKVDLNNYKSITDAKAKLEMELIKNSASAWSKFYKVQVDATTGYASVISSSTFSPSEYMGSDGNYGEAIKKGMAELNKQKSAAQDVADTYNSIIAALEGIADTTNISTAPVSSSSSSSSSKEAEATIETFNWVEKLLERIQARISKLEKTASSTYRTWATRNDALLKQLTEVNTEIIAQQKAYDIYIAKANSVGLSEHYKQLVQNGDYSIEDITDDTLKEQISAYEEWYTKATECSDAIVDLKDKISELGMTHFENIFSEYEDSLSGYKHQVEMLETYIDQTESKGYVVSGNYYKELINAQKLNINMLQEEYAKLKDSLQSSVDTGKIKPYSEAWYDMVDSIRNVQKSLEDSNSSLIEYQNNLRDLEWEAFDRLLDKISNIKDESDFLIELMSDKTMFDESGITDEGQATLGLHAINYNVYLSKADEYAKKIKEINAEIANDPNNQTLIDRRKELIELQQESILASKDEQQAMRDLISEGYDVFLESLQEIINKRKEMLDEMKDMYDYEKNISEQTQEISKLEKILKAYEGDNSEEARAKIQEYKVSLEEAKENLEETEFDRYIKNTEDMLDSLYEEAQEFVNGHLADLERLVSEVIDSTNENASNISETIKESADDVGYTISSKLTNAFDSASNGVADLVSDYNDNFLETMTTLQSTVDDIRNLIAGESNSDNLEKESNYSSDEESLSNPQDRWTQDTNGTWNYYEGGEQVKDSWTKYDKDNKWYHLDENGNMNTNQWIKNKSGTWSYVDGSGAAVTGWHKLGWTDGSNEWYNFDADGNMLENQWVDDYFVGKDGKMKTNTWIGHNGKYYWVGADGKWLDKEGWSLDYKPKDGLPIYEYAKGSKRIPEDQIALIGEMGSELYYDKSSGLIGQVGKGDMVFTNEASQKLWEFSQDPEGFMAKIGMPNLMSNFSLNMPSLSELKVPDVKPVAQNQNVTIDLGGIQMYGVNDPQEFTKQLKSAINDNSSIRKQLKDVAFGDMRGGNSFARYTR
ncbi:MAG: hypothetical protein IJA10_10180 [Lachnospiraceae bacterium]|nr:hypothetical protein [Lachnospiraceae bacterium]